MSKLMTGLILLSLVLMDVAAAQVPPATATTKPGSSPQAKKPVTKPTVQSAQAAVQAAVHSRATTPAATKRAVRADRLDLETTVVSGNRELPKVLYIVPWKKADLGELPAQPFNTLLDEVLQPVDRDVFKREVKYYQAIASGVGLGAGAAKPSVPPPVTAP